MYRIRLFLRYHSYVVHVALFIYLSVVSVSVSLLLSFTDLCFFAILYHFELHQAVMLPKAIALLPTPAVHEFCYFAIVYHFELHQATHYALVLKMAAVAVARKMWEAVVVPLVPNVPNVHPIQLE